MLGHNDWLSCAICRVYSTRQSNAFTGARTHARPIYTVANLSVHARVSTQAALQKLHVNCPANIRRFLFCDRHKGIRTGLTSLYRDNRYIAGVSYATNYAYNSNPRRRNSHNCMHMHKYNRPLQYTNSNRLKPRLHQATCCPATCCLLPSRQHVAGQHVARCKRGLKRNLNMRSYLSK